MLLLCLPSLLTQFNLNIIDPSLHVVQVVFELRQSQSFSWICDQKSPDQILDTFATIDQIVRLSLCHIIRAIQNCQIRCILKRVSVARAQHI